MATQPVSHLNVMPPVAAAPRPIRLGASLIRATGWSLLLFGQVTTTVPAFFVLTGHYRPTDSLAAAAAVGYAALFAAAFALGRRGGVSAAKELSEESSERVAA